MFAELCENFNSLWKCFQSYVNICLQSYANICIAYANFSRAMIIIFHELPLNLLLCTWCIKEMLYSSKLWKGKQPDIIMNTIDIDDVVNKYPQNLGIFF